MTEPTTDSSSGKQVAERKLPVNIGVPIRGLDEAYRLAQNLAVSSLLPDALRGKPSDTLAIILYGQEIGLAPMQAIQSIYVVRGKPQLSADLWTALARKAGHKVRWGHCDSTSATVTIARGDDPDYPLTQTFTLEDAVTAGLCTIKDGRPYARSQNGKPTPWETYPARMLRNRSVSFAGKSQCPEVALGFAIEGDYDYIEDDTAPGATVRPDPKAPVVMDAEVVEQAPDDLAAELERAAVEYAEKVNAGEEV